MLNILLGLVATSVLVTTSNIVENPTTDECNTIVLTGNEAKSYAREMDITDEDSINSITIVYSFTQNEIDCPQLAYFGDDYYIKKETIRTFEETGDKIRSSRYQGPSTATMTVEESISSTFNFEFELGNDYLKATLGYSRTSVFSICDSYSIQVPENTTMYIDCYVLNEVKTYEIWEDDLWFDDFVGEYKSTKPIGLAFANRTY